MKKTTTTILATTLMATSLMAGPKIKLDLGYVGSTGDTETNNGVAKITASSTKKIFGKTVHCNNFISAIYTEANNDEVNKEFEFGHASTTDITEKIVTYTSADYLTSHHRNYDSKISVAVGAGYNIYKNELIDVQIGAGPSFSYENYTDKKPSYHEFGANEYLLAKIALNDTNNAHLKVSAFESADNFDTDYTIDTTAGITAKLMDSVSLNFDYNVFYDNTPSTDNHTNTKTIMSLSYAF